MTRLMVVVAVASVAGCAGSAPSAPSQSLIAPSQALFQPQSRTVTPNACDTGVNVRIKNAGGLFHVPPCSGWTGTINYPQPSAPHRYKWTITSSVTNNFGAPPPPNGTAIFYMQTADDSRFDTGFAADQNVTNTVSNFQLTSGHTYSLMVYGFLFDNQCSSPPCPPWSASIGSPAPGSHSLTFQSPLNGAALAGAAVWQFIQNIQGAGRD
jgi:hypothetical protein